MYCQGNDVVTGRMCNKASIEPHRCGEVLPTTTWPISVGATEHSGALL